MSKMKKTRKPGGGRKKLKPEYDAGKNLKEQMESAVALYRINLPFEFPDGKIKIHWDIISFAC